MSGIPIRKYPPYMGNDPYIFLCFTPQDSEIIMPVLKRLQDRHVRFYYVHAEGKNADEAKLIQERIKGASLMIFFATDHTKDEGNPQKGFSQYFEGLYKEDMRSKVLPEESRKNILLIHYGFHHSETLDYGFSSVPTEISFAVDPDGEKAESAIIHAKGFTQDFIGDAPDKKIWKKVFLILGIVTVLVVSGVFAFLKITEEKEKKAAEEKAVLVPVTDPVIMSAAEQAVQELGFEKFNKGSVEYVETLELNTIPENPEDFALFPNLKKIVVPKEIAPELLELEGDSYTIVLGKGGN